MAFSMAVHMAVALLLLLQLGAAVDENTCLSPIMTLSPCLPYIQNGTPGAPSDACCRSLARVVQDQPVCLCAIIDGEATAWLGIPIDVNRATALPAACNVQTPPISECNGRSEP